MNILLSRLWNHFRHIKIQMLRTLPSSLRVCTSVGLLSLLNATYAEPRKHPVSNPVHSLYIDGDLTDWSRLSKFDLDPQDMDGPGNDTDWKQISFAHSSQSFYLAVEKYKSSEFIYSHSVYIDSDADVSSGYVIGGLGADYLVQANHLYSHAGKSDDFLWHPRATATSAIQGACIEMEFPIASLKSPSRVRILSIADNHAHGGDQLDFYPDPGNTAVPDGPWLEYDFTLTGKSPSIPRDPQAISNFSEKIALDGNLDEWRALTSFGRDGDDIQDSAAYVDWIECWMSHNDHSISLAAELDSPSPLHLGHTIYLDTDQNPETGFRLGKLGADFLIQKESLFHYSGQGPNFRWKLIGAINLVKSGKKVEMSIPRKSLGNPVQIRLAFLGDNGLFGHDENDYFPDNLQGLSGHGARYLVYFCTDAGLVPGQN